MRKATCVRCGKKEGFRKSHERVKYLNSEFYLCVDCSQIAYKMRDANNTGDKALADELERDFMTLPKEKDSLLSGWFLEFKKKQFK
jgi:hypothetical protein